MLFNPKARFELAHRLQRGDKLPLGEVFSFLSGLYFRGKFTYAKHFCRPPRKLHGAYVITSNRGLLAADEPISLDDLRHFSTVPIDADEVEYIEPLRRDASKIAQVGGASCEFVLLGSIGTKKYAEPLMKHFGGRLLFPKSFAGRGDMSRGGLLLRCVAEGRELEYIPLAGAIRHGKRPQKLAARSWGFKIQEGTTPVSEKIILAESANPDPERCRAGRQRRRSACTHLQPSSNLSVRKQSDPQPRRPPRG